MISTIDQYLGSFPYSPPKEYTVEDFPKTGLPNLEGAKEVFKKSLDSQFESLEYWKSKKFSFWNTQADLGNTVFYLQVLGGASVFSIITMSISEYLEHYEPVGITIKIAAAVIGISLLIFGKMVNVVYSQLASQSNTFRAWNAVISNYCVGPIRDTTIEKREFKKRIWLSITKDFFHDISLEMRKINSSNRDVMLKQIRGQFDLFHPRGIYNHAGFVETSLPMHQRYWTQIQVEASQILTADRNISNEFKKLDNMLANTSPSQVEKAINSELDDIRTIFSNMDLDYLS